MDTGSPAASAGDPDAESAAPESEGSNGDSSDSAASPEEVAAANLPLLQPSDDARDVEVLSVTDGSITSLRDAVDGDRPVLLWFWAPH